MRRLLLLPLALLLFAPAFAAAEDTPKAAETRKKLEMKISVEYKDMLFRDVMDDLKDKADVHFRPDTKGGVNLNAKVTYKAKDKAVQEVLTDICTKLDDGFYVISGKTDAYDGSIKITRGKERGYEAGKGPDTKTTAAKEKPEKEKPRVPEKPKVEEKTEKTPPPEIDADEIERIASRRLKLAKELEGDGKPEKAHEVLRDLVKKYPKTKAAEEAEKLLKDQDR